MSTTPDQSVRPLTPASGRRMTCSSCYNVETAAATTKPRRKPCLICCGCFAAFLIVLAAAFLALIFTVFKSKDPDVYINQIYIQKIDLINGTKTPRPGSNVTMIGDLSVKNPSVVSFKYPKTTTDVFYRGTLFVKVYGPAGKSKGRRTMRLNVTADVMVDQIMPHAQELGSDLKSGLLTVDSYTRVGGRLKIIGLQKHVTVKMNCTTTLNLTTPVLSIKHLKCKKKFKL